MRLKVPRLCRVPGRAAWHVYDSRRRVSTGTASRQEAERFLADYLAGSAAPAPGVATLADVLHTYRTWLGPKPAATRVGYATLPLVAQLGHLPPDLLNAATVARYVATRTAAGAAPGTVRIEVRFLKAALRRAGILAALGTIATPPAPPARTRWLTRDEAAALLAACPQRHTRLFVVLALNTAARSGAIFGLTWDRVNLAAGTIDFRDPGRAVSRKRRVAVPINDTLRAALEEARAHAVGSHVVEYGGLPVGRVAHSFREAATRAGLKGVTPHTLRHTAVTWMMQSGVDIWQVSGMAGMTVQLIQEVYGHHHPAHLRGAAAALG